MEKHNTHNSSKATETVDLCLLLQLYRHSLYREQLKRQSMNTKFVNSFSLGLVRLFKSSGCFVGDFVKHSANISHGFCIFFSYLYCWSFIHEDTVFYSQKAPAPALYSPPEFSMLRVRQFSQQILLPSTKRTAVSAYKPKEIKIPSPPHHILRVLDTYIQVNLLLISSSC